MKKFNYKSCKGFTLIELLVVIGILAVLAAIAIPSVAGLIDRANVSSDNTNASEMTNAMERFVAEYEMYCLDVQSGRVNVNDLSSAQSRIYNVVQTTNWEDIQKIENGGYNGISIDQTTKYPLNKQTALSVVQNYAKTSSSTFEPKQSDKHFYYNPDSGKIICDIVSAKYDIHNAKLINGTDGNGNTLSYQTSWIDLTNDLKTIHAKITAEPANSNTIKFSYFIPEAKRNVSTGVSQIFHNGEWKTIKSAKVITAFSDYLECEELTIDTCDGFLIINFPDGTNNPSDGEFNYLNLIANWTYDDDLKDIIFIDRLCIETIDGEILYSQTVLTVFNDVK